MSASPAGRQIRLHDFASNTSSVLTSGTATDISPVFSPDGRQLAFLRNRKELRVMDVAAGTDRVLASAIFADTMGAPRPVWSPDGRWIAVLAIGAKRFTNVELVPVAGGTLRPVSSVASAFADSIAWSPDGTFILFGTNQRTEPGQIAFSRYAGRVMPGVSQAASLVRVPPETRNPATSADDKRVQYFG